MLALKINSTLITLDLGCNSIGDNGTEALSEALKTNSTLTTLYMGGNLIGANGTEALFNVCDNPESIVAIKGLD
ncbi:hypothetical protein BGZ91_009928 [Linnemannia elongata]|nr:hypothetical protein BGZ91_009928 [Linnemannia elongata]